MKSLPATVRDEFEKDGHWVLSKTMNTFSAIPFDQANEQENKIVKGSVVLLGSQKTPLLFDDGCSQGQRWPDYWSSSKKNTLPIMT